MIPIVCVTEELAGMFDQADRETEGWFERDVVVQSYLCTVVYPKMCWKTVYDLELAA